MIPILGKVTSLKDDQAPVLQGVLDEIVRKSTNVRHISSLGDIDKVQYGEVVVFDDGADDQRVAIRTGEDTVLHLCSSTGDVGLTKNLEVTGDSTFATGVVSGDIEVTGTSTFGNKTYTDAKDITIGTSTGTKIGTAASQKLAFYGETPVVQGAAMTDANDLTSTWNGINILLTRLRTVGIIST